MLLIYEGILTPIQHSQESGDHEDEEQGTNPVAAGKTPTRFWYTIAYLTSCSWEKPVCGPQAIANQLAEPSQLFPKSQPGFSASTRRGGPPQSKPFQ
jgi:hypothetical protein